jgi:hypothetical protein
MEKTVAERASGSGDQSAEPDNESYLDLALGMTTPPKKEPISVGHDGAGADMQAMAFGNSVRKIRPPNINTNVNNDNNDGSNKQRRSKRRIRSKPSSVAPDDEYGAHYGSPAAKTSAPPKSKEGKVKKGSKHKKDKKTGSSMTSRWCSICDWMCAPCRRCWNYISTKSLCCAYTQAVWSIISDVFWTDLLRQPKNLVVILGE